MKIDDALKLIDRINNLPNLYDEIDQAVAGTIYSYFEELVAIERKEKKILENETILGKFISEDPHKYLNNKIKIHEKYWSNKSKYYQPLSAGTDLEHDWSRIHGIEILQTGDDDCPQFLFCASYKLDYSDDSNKKAYLLKLIDNQLKIEHEFFG